MPTLAVLLNIAMAVDTKPFEMAAESVKQILTFATALLSITVTFAGDKLMGRSAKIPKGLLTSWCLYFSSIAFGIWTLNAIAGELAKSNPPDLYRTNITIPATLTYVSFVAGILATIVAGYQSLKARRVV